MLIVKYTPKKTQTNEISRRANAHLGFIYSKPRHAEDGQVLGYDNEKVRFYRGDNKVTQAQLEKLSKDPKFQELVDLGILSVVKRQEEEVVSKAKRRPGRPTKTEAEAALVQASLEA